ncbi:MAG: hypothetical protein R3B11_10570 [Nitrospira sp.]|nr:hypothetical protein [Nitrospira sp.]
MQWITAVTIAILGIAWLGYLLWEKAPIEAGSFKLSDLTNLLTIIIAGFSLYVAVAAYQQSIQDSQEQQKSLEASRSQLQAVVDSLSQQSGTLANNLEASRNLLDVQKEQRTVLADSLETMKALLQLQKEERARAQEVANRKPKLEAYIGDKLIENGSIDVELKVKGDTPTNTFVFWLKNIGSASLKNARIMATAPRKTVYLHLTAAQYHDQDNSHWSQLQGEEILPHKSSGKRFGYPLLISGLHNLKSNDKFDIIWDVTAESLESPFRIVMHFNFIRE